MSSFRKAPKTRTFHLNLRFTLSQFSSVAWFSTCADTWQPEQPWMGKPMTDEGMPCQKWYSAFKPRYQFKSTSPWTCCYKSTLGKSCYLHFVTNPEQKSFLISLVFVEVSHCVTDLFSAVGFPSVWMTGLFCFLSLLCRTKTSQALMIPTEEPPPTLHYKVIPLSGLLLPKMFVMVSVIYRPVYWYVSDAGYCLLSYEFPEG